MKEEIATCRPATAGKKISVMKSSRLLGKMLKLPGKILALVGGAYGGLFKLGYSYTMVVTPYLKAYAKGSKITMLGGKVVKTIGKIKAG